MAALTIGAAPAWSSAARPAGSAAASASRPPANGHCITVVIDFGTVDDAPGTRPWSGARSACVTPGAAYWNVYGVLWEAARALGLQDPSANRSGLLCNVGAYPSSGCGQRDGSHYLYWSYWSGSGGTWSYSRRGPGDLVDPCRVEGWRFIDGAIDPGDLPRPRASASAPADCAAPATTPAPPPDAAPHPGVGGGGLAPGSGAGTTPPPPHGTTGPSTSGAPTSAAPTITVAPPAEGATTSTAASQPDEQASGTPGRRPGAGGASTPSGGDDGGSGFPTGLVAGAALLAAVGGAGAFQARRRRLA